MDEKDQKYEELSKKYEEVLKDLALKKDTLPDHDLNKEAEKAYSELKQITQIPRKFFTSAISFFIDR